MLDVPRTTDTVLMVRSYDFGFNEETGRYNEFQQKLKSSAIEINKKANIEFQNMVDLLKKEGVNVLIFEKPVDKLLKVNGYKIRNIINVGRLDETDSFLEGTGSMVIDHAGEIVYAARSKRCNDEQFDNFIRRRFYKEGILFDTASSTGHPVYHTNVMSEQAFSAYSKVQIQRLEQYGKILPVDLTTIETVGGGSARCMLAEIFSERTG